MDVTLTWVDITLSILLGVVSSIISALIFLHIYLRKKKPMLEISPYICKEDQPDGSTQYVFKIVNATKRTVFDIQVEVHFLRKIAGNNGILLHHSRISLINNYYSSLEGKRKDDKEAKHALQFASAQEIEDEWKDEHTYIGLKVIAKHEVSGFSAVFDRDFYKNAIKAGGFGHGDDLNVHS